MTKLFVFDIDGTLVDSQNLIVEAQRRAFAAAGLPAPPREKALSIVGLSLPKAFETLTEGAGPVDLLVQAYKDAWTQLRGESDFRYPVYPGAQGLLEDLARCEHCKIGIATGKTRVGVNALFDRHGWHDIFDTVQTADDAVSKPAPDMFQRALNETGVEPRDAIMIGDTTFDMVMARSVGATAIGVAWGYHRHEKLLRAGASTIAENFHALRQILEEFMQCATT